MKKPRLLWPGTCNNHSANSSDEVHLLQIFSKSPDTSLHLFFRSTRWRTSAREIMTQLALINSSQTRQPCQWKNLGIIREERCHIVLIVEFYLLKLLAFLSLESFHIFITSLEAVQCLIGRLAGSSYEIWQFIGIHIYTIIAIGCSFDDSMYSSHNDGLMLDWMCLNNVKWFYAWQVLAAWLFGVINIACVEGGGSFQARCLHNLVECSSSHLFGTMIAHLKVFSCNWTVPKRVTVHLLASIVATDALHFLFQFFILHPIEHQHD